MDWFNGDIVWPVVGAVVAGALIGLEREYRGSPAGFRTHILVSLASALLMLAAVHQIRWLSDTPQELIRIDPVRMAHGILTGIGFLGAGVIFREGFTIRGLTTAASLWITSAVGTLYGVGFYGLAIGGTVATLLVLGALSITDAVMPQRRYAQVKVRYARSAGRSEASFRALVADFGAVQGGVSHTLEGGTVTFCALVGGRTNLDLSGLATVLSADPEVEGFELLPHAR